MIFRYAERTKIFTGEKTQHRRPVHPNQPTNHYRRGMTRAVQAEVGKHAVTHIRLLDVHREQLGLIDADSLNAEGHDDLAAFARLWLELHDPDGRMRRAAGRDPHAVNGLTDNSVLIHWHERHAGRQVWVIQFERVREAPPLLLSAKMSGGTGPTHPFKSSTQLGDACRRNAAQRDHVRDIDGIGPTPILPGSADALEAKGYTTSTTQSPRDEPEAIDIRDLRPHWTTDAQARHRKAQGKTNAPTGGLRRAA